MWRPRGTSQPLGQTWVRVSRGLRRQPPCSAPDEPACYRWPTDESGGLRRRHRHWNGLCAGRIKERAAGGHRGLDDRFLILAETIQWLSQQEQESSDQEPHRDHPPLMSKRSRRQKHRGGNSWSMADEPKEQSRIALADSSNSAQTLITTNPDSVNLQTCTWQGINRA